MKKMYKKSIFILVLPLLCFCLTYEEPWGKDSNLSLKSKRKKESYSIFTKLADQVINFHQKVISPVDGPRSHFKPSSSQYMREAMHTYGFFKGYFMGCDRLLRENDEKWVYPTISENNIEFKYDPPYLKKRRG